MEKNRSKNVNNSRVTHSVDPAVIEENAKKHRMVMLYIERRLQKS